MCQASDKAGLPKVTGKLRELNRTLGYHLGAVPLGWGSARASGHSLTEAGLPGPVVKTVLSAERPWVQSLVRKLDPML